jgi:hypothetical protein
MHVFAGLGIHSKDNPHPVRDAKPAHDAELPPRQRCRATGMNYASAPDGIYVAAGPSLIRFDPVDGRRTAEWKVPLDDKELCWGAVRIAGDVLVATAFSPQDIIDADAGADGNGGEWSGDRMPMAHLVAIDRGTGRRLWTRKAAWGFLNRGGVALGGGKVYCVDLLLEVAREKFQEAGRGFPQTPPMLYALDLETGAEVWKRPLEWRAKGVVYAAERDLLIVPCRNNVQWKDGDWFNGKKAKIVDGLKGDMRALRGSDGTLLWEVNDESYDDPPLPVDRPPRAVELQEGRLQPPHRLRQPDHLADRLFRPRRHRRFDAAQGHGGRLHAHAHSLRRRARDPELRADASPRPHVRDGAGTRPGQPVLGRRAARRRQGRGPRAAGGAYRLQLRGPRLACR